MTTAPEPSRPPAMTITMPADKVGAVAAGWLRDELADFQVRPFAEGVFWLQCIKCDWWKRYRRTTPLTELLRSALEHGQECDS